MRSWNRWWPLTGLLFVALFLTAFVLVGDTGDTPEDAAAELGDASDRLAAAYVAGAASLIPLFAFFAGLRDLVRDAAPSRSVLAMLTLVPVAAGAALLVTSLSLLFGGGEAAQDVEMTPLVAEVVMDAQYGALAAGFTCLGIAVFAASLALLRSRALPSWLAVAGLVVGAVQIVSWMFIPILALLLWLLVASIVLAVRTRPAVPATV